MCIGEQKKHMNTLVLKGYPATPSSNKEHLNSLLSPKISSEYRYFQWTINTEL